MNSHIHNLFKNTNVYWINLDRSLDRKKSIELLFETNNILNTRISAVDGAQIDENEYRKKMNAYDKMSLNEIACTCSHIKAIRCALDNNDDYAIIMEDDINFEYLKYHSKSFLQIYNELTSFGGECLQLSSTHMKKDKDYARISNDKNFYTKGWQNSAVSYLITKSGMLKVLKYIEDSKMLYVSERTIFANVENYITKPYFTYHFYFDVKSTIRDATKSANATQTRSKMWWNEYYKIRESE